MVISKKYTLINNAIAFAALILTIIVSVSCQEGIKTGINSGNLIYYPHNGTTVSSKPPIVNIQNDRRNNTATFMNRTITSMASGICFKEVPTASLVHDHSHIPAGNGSNPTMSRIQVCCEGYERNAHVLKKCDPICREECINGLCVAPDRCQCFPDHVRNLGNICIATCPIGCGNGVCGQELSCNCNEGYKLDASRKFCIPICSQGCSNGNCTAPETCNCINGYKLNDVTRKCEPICVGGCEFGQCVAPGQCSCLPGYQKVGNTCQAICLRGCNNGQCTAPNVCTCSPGWIIDSVGTTCKPDCERPCINGRCSEPNVCSCFNGYILEEGNPFRCIAHCPNGCPNGVCSGPGFCLCKVGFVKDRSVKGSQSCIPSTL